MGLITSLIKYETKNTYVGSIWFNIFLLDFQVIPEIYIWDSGWNWIEVYEQVLMWNVCEFKSFQFYKSSHTWLTVFPLIRRTHEDLNFFNIILNQEIRKLSAQVLSCNLEDIFCWFLNFTTWIEIFFNVIIFTRREDKMIYSNDFLKKKIPIFSALGWFFFLNFFIFPYFLPFNFCVSL
jgi:hypothetical protein